MSNIHADCDATSTSSFNPSSGILQLTYDVDEFTRNPNCTNTTTPEMFGYKSFLHTNSFDIKVDVRSVFTAVALNSGIANVGNLQRTEVGTYNYSNIVYNTANYVDSQFPGMKPVPCLFPNASDLSRPLCTMIIGDVYAIPLFNHAGHSFNLPVPCNCTEQLKLDVATNPYNLCKLFVTN